jgi:hypothetical protein
MWREPHPWHLICIAAFMEASNDERLHRDLRRYARGWRRDMGLWGGKHATSPDTTETVRVLADDPALKLASERSPYMRTER